MGGRLETSSQVLPTLDISYFLTDHWSIEATTGVIPTDGRLKKSQQGDFKVSHTRSGTASLVAHYNFLLDAALNPCLRAGVNHTWFISVEFATGVPEITMESITSPLFDAGQDYRLFEYWYATASVRYVITPAQHFNGDGFNAKSDIDVLVLGAGMGLRF
ncbi:OmpW/AlkL family protein [Kushneria phyllosphaerae]|uniref:Porin n=1 Tax=Kushneria phyllosphaerae TaxID=2100822 RepID=A0A2R8CPU0_9GAMM|nr:OmpW family outer membrane protein [Kushneria phyllosphaerae]SPJ34852.1 hypothetical protein KSP9073_02899 [Kushneria phyllosphaerae]